MLESEVNALICALNRLYVSLWLYLSAEIKILPEDCEKLDIEPYDVGRLFSYIIDYDPDIFKRLFIMINDDWRRMCNRWWLCMCAYYHPDKIKRAICKDKLFGTWIWDIGGVKRISLKDDKYIPDFCQIEYKRDKLKQIIQFIDELKYWSNNHVWQSPQREQPQDKQLSQLAVPGDTMPSELDTPQARQYFQKAEEAGFVTKTSTGYKWVSGNISECAYFCALCSDALKLSKTENRIAWKPFAALFGYSSEQLIQAKSGWTKTGQPPARYKAIETVFM